MCAAPAVSGPDHATSARCRICGTPLEPAGEEMVCPSCAPTPAPKDFVSTDSVRPPTTLGDYELLEELGRGGMGVVYRARQRSLDRTVALKLLLAGRFANQEFVARFRAEAAAAAALQHPNIVAIHEVGVHHGQHYFSMEYVEGRTLAELVRDGPLQVRRSAEYMRTIALAMHHAHEHGIMHRDLKPSNVMVDADDQPHITDFGLAKHVAERVELTVSGQLLGSLGYIPPEQVEAHRGNAGPTADVYGLGATLYHLLTGRAPFTGGEFTSTLQQVLTAEPVSPRALNAAVPIDLATICLKCLEKDPARRYPTARALADELDRFLKGDPIQARVTGPADRFVRWCRRKPLVAVLCSAVVVSGALGVAGITWQSAERREAVIEARLHQQEAQAQRQVAEGRLYAAQVTLAHTTCRAGRTAGAMELLNRQVPLPGDLDLRGFEWRYLYRLCRSRTSEILGTNAGGYQSVTYSQDGRRMAFGTTDGFVELFLTQDRRLRKRWRAHTGPVDRLAFYPEDTGWLATVSGGDGVLKLWDVRQERVVFSTRGARGMWVDFAFSPSGTLWVTRSPDAHSTRLWAFRHGSGATAPTLTWKRTLPYQGPAAFSPDRRTLALGNRPDGAPAVALIDLATGGITELESQHTDRLVALAFSADGSRLASGGGDERIVVWDVERRTPVRTFDTDLVVVTTVAFSPDGQRLFASGLGQSIVSWTIDAPDEIQSWPGHGSGVNALAVAPDGESVASAGRDGTARLWDVRRQHAVAPRPADPARLLLPVRTPMLPDRDPLRAVAVSPDQQTVAAIAGGSLTVLGLPTGRMLGRATAEQAFGLDAPGFTALTFSPDGTMIVAGSAGGSVAFLDTTTLQPVRASMDLHPAMLWNVAFAMDGTVLATSGGFGGTVKLVDVRSRLPLGSPIEGVEGAFPPQPIAVSPDGKLLAAGSPESRVRVWDIASGRRVASSPHLVRLLHSVAFSPEGGLLAYADERGSVFLWDVNGVRPPRTLHVPGGPATTLAFSPDGRTLASGHMDHTIRLWHPDIDQEVAILSEHEGWVVSVAFADHGNALLSASRDGTLRLWPAAPPDEIPLPAAPRRSGVTSSHPRRRRAHALGRPLPPGRL